MLIICKKKKKDSFKLLNIKELGSLMSAGSVFQFFEPQGTNVGISPFERPVNQQQCGMSVWVNSDGGSY